jgi:hypothetical protein
MRITKKYAGSNSIGKQVFQPSEEFLTDSEAVRRIELELEKLESLFFDKILSKTTSNDDVGNTDSIRRTPSSRNLRSKEKPSSEYSDYYTGDLADVADLEDAPTRKKSRENSLSTNIFPMKFHNKNDGNNAESELFSAQLKSTRRVFSTPNLHSLSLLPTSQRVSSGNNNPTNATHTATAAHRKRSHSVIDLVDFEKLVEDDRAAGACDILAF